MPTMQQPSWIRVHAASTATYRRNKNEPLQKKPFPASLLSLLQFRRGLNVLQAALIIPFAILGLLIRLGVKSIESFAGQQIFELVWPQFIGCLILGCLIATREWIERGFGLLYYKGSKRGHWLGPFFYVALSSGLCGSITTFSSWNLDTFIQLINPARINRSPLQNILSALAEVTATLAMSLAGLQLGDHLGQALIWKVDSMFPPGPSVAPEDIEAVLAEEDTTAQAGTEGNTPLPGMEECSSPPLPQQQLQMQLQRTRSEGTGPSVAPLDIEAVLAEEDTTAQAGTEGNTPLPGMEECSSLSAPQQLQLQLQFQQITVPAPAASSMATVTPEPIPLPKAPAFWTIEDWLLIPICSALWLGTVFAAIWMPTESYLSWRYVTLATCFAPLGAILRWYLSQWNAAGLRRWKFPVGTFLSNIIGSVVLAVVLCLEHSTAIEGQGGAAAACQVLSGLQDGFCGCLTTISTFTLELKTLPRKASYIYGVTSVVVTQLAMLLIVGTFVWTQSSIKDQENGYNQTTCHM